MKALFAFLADFALAHPDGKLYVVGGGIDTLVFQNLPAASPQLSLVVRIEFPPVECDRPHVIEIHPLTADGQPFLPAITMQLTPSRNPYPGLPTSFPFVVTMTAVLFSSVGDYAFSIVGDAQEVASVRLRVVEAPPEAAASGPLG